MENMYRRSDPYERETASLPQRRRTPSFSSSLLDSIYRSIDESSIGGADNTITTFSDYKETVIVQKQSLDSSRRGEDKASSLGRAIMIENWREKKKESSYGSSSSSDSCSSAVFSSSEESNFRGKSRKAAAPVMPTRCLMFDRRETGEKQRETPEGNFTKTKVKALKLYSELKKVKQPISPGGRISSFLNSIFNGNARKMCSAGEIDDVSYERKSKSACSSAASLSRSCLSKSSSKKANRKKNSVRFYPVSVIVDEDCRPCGHKSIYEKDPSLMPRSTPSSSVHPKSIKKTTLKEELRRNFSIEKHSQRKISKREFHYNYKDEDEEEDEDDDDDDASCSSSDLFELDHLIGIGRYREELPVYETTNLNKNQAIANGFMI